MKIILRKFRASIALITMIIISAFTLILVLAMAEANISTGYQAVNNVSNRTAYYLAEACLEEAIIRLESDSSFTSETIVFDSDISCIIDVSGSSDKNVSISVSYFNYFQTFDADVSLNQVGELSNAQLDLWQEI